MAYRDSYASAGMGGPRLTPWVLRLLIAHTAAFLALFIAGDLLRLVRADQLAFIPLTIAHQPWSVVTFAFTHPDPFELLFGVLMLYFFGGTLEEHWGGAGFLKFYAASLAGAVVAALALATAGVPGTVAIGMTAASYGMLLAFAMLWPEMEINIWGIFPVKAKWLALFSAALGFILSVKSGGYGLANLGGFATAWLFLKSPWAPHAWGEVPALRAAPRKKAAPQSKAVVQWIGKKESPAAPASARPPVAAAGARRASRAEKELLDDVDRILDKISAQGLSSLTEDERKRLDEVSRRYRTN
jgi:membrane associated rhomboid family serine protease